MSFNFEFTKDVPEDLWIKGEGLQDDYVNPLYHNVIFASLAVGINDIKDEKAAEEFYRRMVMYDMTSGYTPYGIELRTVKQCIGLRTNAPTKTIAAFKAAIFKRLTEVADQKLKNAEEVQTV